MARPKKMRIHSSVKTALGYDADMPDKKFIVHWKKRSTAVCKPCWELKYCPYGPFVEQSPHIPMDRKSAIEHNQYLTECLSTNRCGGRRQLDAESRKLYREMIDVGKGHPEVLAALLLKTGDIESDQEEDACSDGSIVDDFAPPLRDFERYKLPFPLVEDDEDGEDRFALPKMTPSLHSKVDREIKRMEQAIETGIDDQSRPLDKRRRTYFEEATKALNEGDYPEEIPDFVSDASCNIFGHVCPVIFVGESITETNEKRRRGRYIPFATKMRVVRRDNHTCQECGKHLRDDEVEFDHIIPIAKGGSSEEHNIRLTCFDCNRGKTDRVAL